MPFAAAMAYTTVLVGTRVASCGSGVGASDFAFGSELEVLGLFLWALEAIVAQALAALLQQRTNGNLGAHSCPPTNSITSCPCVFQEPGVKQYNRYNLCDC